MKIALMLSSNSTDMEIAVAELTPAAMELLEKAAVICRRVKEEELDKLYEMYIWHGICEFYGDDLVERLDERFDAQALREFEANHAVAITDDLLDGLEPLRQECQQTIVRLDRVGEATEICWGAYQKHGDEWVTTRPVTLLQLRELLTKGEEGMSYYKTVITLTVLSNQPLNSHMDLADVAARCETGDYFVSPEFGDSVPLTRQQTARALVEQNADPAFLLGENGWKYALQPGDEITIDSGDNEPQGSVIIQEITITEDQEAEELDAAVIVGQDGQRFECLLREIS